MSVAAQRVNRGRGLGASMAGGNPDPARGRSENDFYATPDDVTLALLRRWGHHVGGTVWEPCAGNGKMAQHILTHRHTTAVFASDIAPRPESEWFGRTKIVPLDLFTVKARDDGKARFQAIVTNPPFDIAAAIIEHVFTQAEPGVKCVALLLKATYWHAVKRQPLFNAFPPSVIAPLTWRPDFMDLGGPTMEMAWNIWLANTHGGSTLYEPLNREG